MPIPKGSPMGSPKVSSKGNIAICTEGLTLLRPTKAIHFQPKPPRNPPETLIKSTTPIGDGGGRSVVWRNLGARQAPPQGRQKRGRSGALKADHGCEASKWFTSHSNTITVVFGGLLSTPNIGVLTNLNDEGILVIWLVVG